MDDVMIWEEQLACFLLVVKQILLTNPSLRSFAPFLVIRRSPCYCLGVPTRVGALY